jgi:hypothetical protein
MHRQWVACTCMHSFEILNVKVSLEFYVIIIFWLYINWCSKTTRGMQRMLNLVWNFSVCQCTIILLQAGLSQAKMNLEYIKNRHSPKWLDGASGIVNMPTRYAKANIIESHLWNPEPRTEIIFWTSQDCTVTVCQPLPVGNKLFSGDELILMYKR